MDRDNPFNIGKGPPGGAQSSKRTAFDTLRQYVQDDEEEAREEAAEYCELCSVELLPRHRHLLNMESRQVTCACDPCALRFENVVDGRFKLIPRDTRALPDFRMTDVQWNRLSLPIDLAFFFQNAQEDDVTALYPSPAGATESLLPLDAWDALVDENPVLEQMEPDVEALLVNRVGETRGYYLAPIDTCYKLVGLIRLHWEGLSGGEKVWDEIGRYFDQLEGKAKPLTKASVANDV